MAVALLAAACFSAASAGAVAPTSDERAAAQALFDEGKALMASDDVKAACPKFAESQRLDPGIGTLFNLAACYEKLGLIASAWSNFLEVASTARAAGQPDREAVARDRARALEPRLSKLVIAVPPASRIAGLEIRRQESLVGEAQWGSAVPVDVGNHSIAASAPGRKPWLEDVTVAREAETVTIEVPALDVDTASNPSQESVRPVSVANQPTVDLRSSATPFGIQRTLALGVAAIGVIGLGVGTFLAVDAKSDDNASEKSCSRPPGAERDQCDPDGFALRENAIDKGNIATFFFIGSTVALGASAVLWFTARDGPAESGQRGPTTFSASLVPQLGLSPISAAISFRGNL